MVPPSALEPSGYEDSLVTKPRTLSSISKVESSSRDSLETSHGTLDSLAVFDSLQQDSHPFPEEQVPEGGRDQRLLDLLQLDSAQLKPEEVSKLQMFLLRHADLFALDETELGSTDIVTHAIETGNHAPVHQPIRRTPFALRKQVMEMVQRMLDQGVIKLSKSPWASPIVLVKKSDGNMRFCVDYRRLNAITKADVFPLPRIDDSLDLLGKAKYFTTLDLASGYWQVRMEPESREKTAFVTYSGHYEFQVMHFGLTNAPATFQRLMETVLAGLVSDCAVVYLDDILVMGKSFEEQLSNLEKVFADPRKVEAVHNFPPPVTLKALQSFLGLASYYRRSVPAFSKVAHPLYLLTRKNTPFAWTPGCQQAFQQLKLLLTSAPLLAYPDFNRDFLVETDASGCGLGAVLAQQQDDLSVRPVAYASRTLQRHEQNYGISELEALAVVWAVKHFRPYLYGHHTEIYTDHIALKSLLNTPQPSGKLARWGLAIQELDVKICYRPGKKNSNADALSRAPITKDTSNLSESPCFGIVSALFEPQQEREATLPLQQREDADLLEIIEYVEGGKLPVDENRARQLTLAQSQYEVQDGTLYHVEGDKTLRIIPPKGQREKLFQEVHAGPFGAHLREAKIHSVLNRHYWWPGIRKDIAGWCKSCLTCTTRLPGRAIKPPLTPIPVAGPFDRLGVVASSFLRCMVGTSTPLCL